MELRQTSSHFLDAPKATHSRLCPAKQFPNPKSKSNQPFRRHRSEPEDLGGGLEHPYFTRLSYARVDAAAYGHVAYQGCS